MEKPKKYLQLKKIPRPFVATLLLLGLTLLLICLIPARDIEEVINTSFTLNPGAKYGPYDEGTVYHTRILCKSVLKGEVTIAGEAIYLTVFGYNTHQLKEVYVKERLTLVIDPANDQYTFVFNNTRGNEGSSVTFLLEETWVTPLILSSSIFFVTGLVGFSLFITGFIAITIAFLRRNLTQGSNP